jgi:uncharacterized protein
VQSILPSILPRWRLRRQVVPLLRGACELTLDCGDGVRLQAFHTESATAQAPIAVLLHGWEGSADSYYILSLGQALLDAGISVVRLNLRDHGDTHHLNPDIFHSCRLAEVCGAIAQLGQLFPSRQRALVGFSLGGNFMLRVAASDDPRIGTLAGVIAISPVLHPDSAMLAMERGWQVYQRYFVSKWSRSLRRKQALWPDRLQLHDILSLANLRRMTAALVAEHTTFASMADYLEGYAITGERLATLHAPAVLLAAEDDPIIPVRDLSRLARPALLRVETRAWGGHMGFMTSPFRRPWINDFVLQQLRVFLRTAGPVRHW